MFSGRRLFIESKRANSTLKKRSFKEPAVQLLECVTPECYEKTKEKLKAFIEEEGNTLADWLEWWDHRKGFLFRAFAPFGPRMNQAESVHGGWAKKDPTNMTLLKVAEAVARESKILDVEYEGLKGKKVRGPEDLVPFLDEEHKHILRQVVGLTIP